jgi:hypothetical protein
VAKRRKTSSAWNKLKKVRNKLQYLLKSKYKEYVGNLGELSRENPKAFWTFVKNKTKSGSVPYTIKRGNTLITDPVEKAEAFNCHFHSMFNRSESKFTQITSNSSEIPELCNIQLTVDEVLKILRGLEVSKAIGPDGISPVILKECCDVLSPSLCVLFNLSLSKGYVPADWRLANVVPIFKSGDKQSIANYRPVSLLSIISKVFERCIHNRIYPYISHCITDYQHGFVKGKSTCSQMLRFTDFIGSCLDNNSQVDVIYLDFAKAFDTVPHNLLLKKLSMYGFGGNMLRWFSSYLSNRHQRVVIDGNNSNWLPVLSGVPQGSILGPLMFILYINDIHTCINYSNIALFADDTKLYTNVKSNEDCVNLQKDLDSMLEWGKKWKMKLNISKCKILTITLKNEPINYNYIMYGENLQRCTNIKDIGVFIDDKLNWNQHVQTTVCKARRITGLIKRTVGCSAPNSVKKQLYMSLVRSSLEYCSPVWSGTSVQNIVKIERIQRYVTRFILNYSWKSGVNYRERLIELNMLPLAYRREYLDLCLFFKCYNNIPSVHTSNRITRSKTNNSLNIPSTHILLFQKMYFNRIVFLWNCLPVHIQNVTHINSFKLLLKQHFISLLNNYFDCNNTCTWSLKCRCNKCRLQ